MKIVDLDQYRKEHQPQAWLAGPAVCPSCQHRFVAATEVGHPTGLECPACQRTTAYIVPEVCPDRRWACHCGCDVFRLSTDHPICISCGTAAEAWDRED